MHEIKEDIIIFVSMGKGYSMKLFIPTLVYSESGCVKAHSKELAALGTKAMIVTGGNSSKRNGSLSDVEQALSEEGIPYVIYDEVEENPSVETVVRAARMAIKNQADFFIGVGGGSPMDATKAISVLAKNPEKMEYAREALYTKEKLDAYPVAAVPTTCGTGSEVTPYAILTVHEKHTKKRMEPLIFPTLALVDAGYLKTMSKEGLISTAVDALAHLIESYLNTNSNEYNRMYAREGLCIWGSVKDVLQKDAMPKNEELEELMHASVLAGMAISHTGTSIPHALSYPVTYELQVSHGKAVGIFLPGFLRNYEKQEEVKQIMKLLGFTKLVEFSSYIEEILGRVEIPEELWNSDITELFENPAKLKNYPFTLSREIIDTYYER